MAGPSAVAIIKSENPPAYVLELRPTDAEVPGITYPGMIGLFGGHGNLGEPSQENVARELGEELTGLHFVQPPSQLWSRETDSREGSEEVRRRVSLFDAIIRSAAEVSLSPNLKGSIALIPATEQAVDANKDRLTPFAYAALKHTLSGKSWEGWDPTA